MLNSEERQKIVGIIGERIKSISCPMCKNTNFVLGDGYFSNTIQTDLLMTNLGGPNIPTVPIICTNCGFVSQHALGVLGLLPKEEQIKKDEPNK